MKKYKTKRPASSLPALSTGGSRGFGLLEVMVASGIIIIILMGAVYLAIQALQSAVVSRHRTIAAGIAQDEMEKIRQERDTFYVDGVKHLWTNDIAASLLRAENNSYTFGRVNFEVSVRVTIPDNLDDGNYNPDIVDFSNFEVLENEAFRKVEIEVSWTDYNRPRNVNIQTFLTNWRE